ncbi:hypothetical protein ABFO19_10160 [Xanthomonas citri pv. glycines]|uniref:DUF6896 domain-containing protein n=2 Tax=Xanthomonas TaxID=338 RepID=UPI0005438CB2|nr:MULTISPECIES: hypothetical protein [Xanthomonas]CEJ43041.1 conserved hypothetical protein [Xanthomonas citri pv. bilvae]QDR45095.1 hypothetical protein FPK90_10660 [Xanthomonas citri pv. glycines]QTK36547.1 hypothetical protein XcgCFBP2526_10465 [Xanthomonas citri pv. glycines CFBP 2526]QTK40982.1 hypothetical protein XcgCFBP7119R_10310 [Xanthomonas citri pv. glycines]TSJ95589.1 hypothetical protein FPK99_14810 [Xanthomonas citri pv. glycines]
MSLDNINFFLIFVNLQCRLMSGFSEKYPAVKDWKWLSDFPRNGEIMIDFDQWKFARHGSGLRFKRVNREPNWVVDIHKFIDKPKTVDSWRLLQFYESCGEIVDEAKIVSSLNEFCSKGIFISSGPGQYTLAGC